ncbi:MAG: DUF5330 domain-containing protein [Rhizobiales bacterium]|nr:DUF5330 domain-containing protein [Hyphomicrobiales bacterium]
MFLIKSAFWLTVAIAFIPVSNDQLDEGQRNITTAETISLAQSVIQDASSFCERNPRPCETGSMIVSQLGVKAREGARIAYTYLDDNYGKQTQFADHKNTDLVNTGSILQK